MLAMQGQRTFKSNMSERGVVGTGYVNDYDNGENEGERLCWIEVLL